MRLAAADVLARSAATDAQLKTLTDAMRKAGPLEIPRLLPAFNRSTDDEVGRKLVEALKQSPAIASLRVEILKPSLEKFGEAVRREAASLYRTIDADEGSRAEKLESLLKTLDQGDVRRGQAVFNGPKAACLSCHAVGYLGGDVGPDLSGIGKIRSRRDLLEAIVFPGASFVRSYEPAAVATRDGRVVSGLIRKDSADEVILITGANQTTRIDRREIEAIHPGRVSVMPAGLDSQLSKRELADLLAFLLARK